MKVPQTPGLGRPCGSIGPQTYRVIKFVVCPFRLVLRYSDPRQYSRSPLRDLGVNALIIIKELRIWCREGPPTGYLRQCSQRIHSVPIIKAVLSASARTSREQCLLKTSHGKKPYTYVRLQVNCLSFVSDFNQIRGASKILGTNSDMKF
jgi:hypothetical protein